MWAAQRGGHACRNERVRLSWCHAGETVSHYTGLNAILSSINNPNFTVLGFPCNQFGGQEPGDNDGACVPRTLATLPAAKR